MGLESFTVVLTTSLVKQQWEMLVGAFGDYMATVGVIELAEWRSLRSGLGEGMIVCGSVRSREDSLWLEECMGSCAAPLLCISTGFASPFLGNTIGGRIWRTRRVKHRALGGLTSARHWLCWTQLPNTVIVPSSPSRSGSKFLEPSTRLDWWSTAASAVSGPIWDTGSQSAAPWPIAPDLHLYTYTVFFDQWVYRPLSDKEWAQLVDLRPEWGCRLRAGCSLWGTNGGVSGVIPLRFFVELGLSATGTHPSTVPFFSRGSDPLHSGRQLDPRVVWAVDPSRCRDRLLYFGWHWEESDLSCVGTATTHDDAGVKFHIWAVGGSGAGMEEARQLIRGGIWRWWIQRTRRVCMAWLRSRLVSSPDEQEADRAAMRDCLGRLANSNWFEWADGSRIHFWRWPERWLVEARDGAVPWMYGQPERRLTFGTKPLEEWMVEADAVKIAKLIHRRYLEKGLVRVVIPRHIVPKGETDIRVVWDMTKNGVNGLIFAPTFFLMGIYSLNLRMHAEAWVGDFDCGEMFNNFSLHPMVRSMFGVYLSDDVKTRVLAWLQELKPSLRPEEQWCMEDLATYMRWCRLPFGWRPAPIFAVRMMMRAVEMAKGPPEDRSSLFCFEEVVLNLPGAPGYDPGLPRVWKRRHDKLVACDVGVFVDDGRVTGATYPLCLRAMRVVVAFIQWLGIQDAPRKREAPTQTPRAYTGGVTHTDKGTLRKFLVEKKWLKMKRFVKAVVDCEEEMDRKEFESGVGFLIHCSATYDFIRPYMVGFYLAMNKFRPERDVDGWRMDGGSEDEVMGDKFEELDLLRRIPDEHRPKGEHDHIPVVITSLLRRNAETLERLLYGDTPLQLLIRPVVGSDNVIYAGSDASGEGFGTRDWKVGDESGEFVFGYWNINTDSSSSNWREMKAALDKIREDVERSRLVGREVWFITDNSTLERAYYKGYSSSKELYYMVEELRSLTLRGNFLLHIVHVAGTRIIETGIDGLSRGELELGLLRKSLRDSIPVAQAPFERAPMLEAWVRSWGDCDGRECRVASPMDWHYEAHQSRDSSLDSLTQMWIWNLPPAAGLYALEELAAARTKRLDLLRGIVVVPDLMAPEWMRRFIKAVDVYFKVPAGSIPEWGLEMHETLTIGLYLPSFRSQPWDWKNVPWMGDFGRTLSRMHKQGDPRAGDLLPQFWSAASRVPDMPSRVVFYVLSASNWMPLCGYSTCRRRRRSVGGEGEHE